MILCLWFIFGYYDIPWSDENRLLLICLVCHSCCQPMLAITADVSLSHNKIVKTWPLNSLVGPKLDLTTVLVVLMACCCGWKSQEHNNMQRLMLIVANSMVEEKANTDSTFKWYVMPTIILLMCLYSPSVCIRLSVICHIFSILMIT